MKTAQVLLTVFLGLFFSEIVAQQPDTIAQKVKRKVWLTLIGKDRKVESLYTEEGGLYRIDDSSLVLAKETKWYSSNTPKEMISVDKIWDIQIEKKGMTGAGIFVGMGMGILIGGIIGYRSAGPCKPGPSDKLQFCFTSDPDFTGIVGAVIGIFPGTIAGGLIGSKISLRKVIPIKGRYDLYNAQREKLKKISITGQ